MATISSPGVGSGLDVRSIVSQLVAIERRPLSQLQTAASRIQTQISAFGKMQGALAALREAAAALATTDTWGAVKATSSRPQAVSASVVAGSPPGSYSVTVPRLAAGQVLASGLFADRGAVVGQGTLRIELGDWDAVPPVPKTGSPAVDVAIGPGNDTLEGLRDRINAANAGVSASIVSDLSGSRLVIRSIDTGSENGFRIVVSGDTDGDDGDATGLSALAYDASGGSSRLLRTKAAADALVEVDGLTLRSKSNTIDDAVGGLTLTLTQAGPDPVEISVGQDRERRRSALDAFVAAYNAAVTLLREQTKVDPGGSASGPLQGDRIGSLLTSRLRELMGGSVAGAGAFSRLAEVGLDVQTDGTIKVVASKLDNALAGGDDLARLFAGGGSDPASRGFGHRLRDWLGQVLGSDGTLASRTEGLQQRLKSNRTQQQRLEDRVALTEQRLLRQYSALDTRLGELNGLSTYMTQQLAQFNRSRD